MKLASTQKFTRQLPLYVMLIPGVLLVLVFKYIPMAGIVIAFQKFIPAKGFFGDQEWCGLDNFRYLLAMPDFSQILTNTLTIAVIKIILNLVIPITVAISLNEVLHTGLKRTVQTLIYLPHFLSWVILGGIIIDILSPSKGIINQILVQFGIEPIYFLGSNRWFPAVVIATDVWKEFGFGTIIYLSALTAIDPSLYESAKIDGANRWKMIWNITIPGMKMIIVLMCILKLGNVLNAGFDQIFNLYSPAVYRSGDIIDTFVYRIGLEQAQYGVSTAVGLFKSGISCILVSFSYYMAYKFVDYKIF